MKLTLEIPCNKAQEAVRNITVASHIIRLVSRHCNVSIADLESSDRHWCYCWPRWIAIALIRRHTNLSLSKIGCLFNRDHAAILHAIRGADNEVNTNCASGRQFTYLHNLVVGEQWASFTRLLNPKSADR